MLQAAPEFSPPVDLNRPTSGEFYKFFHLYLDELMDKTNAAASTPLGKMRDLLGSLDTRMPMADYLVEAKQNLIAALSHATKENFAEIFSRESANFLTLFCLDHPEINIQNYRIQVLESINEIKFAKSSGHLNNCGLHGIVHTIISDLLKKTPSQIQTEIENNDLLHQIIEAFFEKNPTLPKNIAALKNACQAFSHPGEREFRFGQLMREVVQKNIDAWGLQENERILKLHLQRQDELVARLVAFTGAPLQIPLLPIDKAAPLEKQFEACNENRNTLSILMTGRVDEFLLPQMLSKEMLTITNGKFMDHEILGMVITKLGYDLECYYRNGVKIDEATYKARGPSKGLVRLVINSHGVKETNGNYNNHWDVLLDSDVEMQRHNELMKNEELIYVLDQDKTKAVQKYNPHFSKMLTLTDQEDRKALAELVPLFKEKEEAEKAKKPELVSAVDLKIAPLAKKWSDTIAKIQADVEEMFKMQCDIIALEFAHAPLGEEKKGESSILDAQADPVIFSQIKRQKLSLDSKLSGYASAAAAP